MYTRRQCMFGLCVVLAVHSQAVLGREEHCTCYVGHPRLGLTSVSAPPGWPRKRSTPNALLGYTYWFLKLSDANIQFVFGGGIGEAMHSTALT